MIPASIITSTSPTDILSYLTDELESFAPDSPPPPHDPHSHLSQYISNIESSTTDYLSHLVALERALLSPTNTTLPPQDLALHLSHTDFPTVSFAQTTSSPLLDDLTNLVLSLAVDRKVPLPACDPADSPASWFAQAIRTLADSPPEPTARPTSTSPLADLQFAHAYLTRQYLEQQNAHAQQAKTTAANAERAHRAETLLRELSHQLEQTAQQLVRSELALAEKTQTAHELLMQNALLKVDSLGSSTLSPPATPSSLADLVPSSPSTSFSSPSTTDPPSVRILRMEFKKLVADLNAKFAHELDQLKQHQQYQQPTDSFAV